MAARRISQFKENRKYPKNWKDTSDYIKQYFRMNKHFLTCDYKVGKQKVEA